MSPEQDEFAQLVERLRPLGAVRVRSGDHEVAFGEAFQAPTTPDAPRRKAPLSKSEREELEELRAKADRDEELL